MESALNAVVFVVGLVFLTLREMLRVKEAGGSFLVCERNEGLK